MNLVIFEDIIINHHLDLFMNYNLLCTWLQLV